MLDLTHHTTQLRGIDLHYVSAGDGPVLLFLHGFPDFWYIWRTQLEAFAPSYRAVALDMRGYNLSGKPDAIADYAVSELIADVIALLDHLGVPSATLVGHDWGGVVAWETAHAHPQRIEKLVILNAPHPDIFRRELAHNPAQQAASAYIERFATAGFERMLLANNCAALTQIVITPGLAAGYLNEEDQHAYHSAWTQPGAIASALEYYRAANYRPGMAYDPAMVTCKVNTPTLVIWGERDTALLTGNLDGLNDVAPNAQIHRVPDATHAIVHEKPALISDLIRSFLA
jgi:epoxide hydrolase 4